MRIQVERFDARERSAGFRDALGPGAFPPWVIWGDPASEVWWDRVRAWFPEFQVVLLGDDEPVAAGWGVPVDWDGSPADLPTGYTDTLRRAVRGRETGVAPNTLVICAAVVLPSHSRSGLAAELLVALRDLPAVSTLAHVLAPVRPASKARYPLTSVDVYAAWTRSDGLPLDPWLRTHVRIGGKVIAIAPCSQGFSATVARWEDWAAMPLPSTGQYLLRDALAPLQVDRERDVGTMIEANIWVQHR